VISKKASAPVWPRGWGAVIGAALAAAPSCALAQEASSTAPAAFINPTVLTPQAKPPARVPIRAVGPARKGLEPPANADKIYIAVRSIRLVGAFSEMQAENEALIGALQGRRLSLAEIYRTLQTLQAAYSRSYPLARVSIEDNDFRGGDVHVKVTDVYIESLDLSQSPERVRDIIAARVQPLVGKRHLTLEEYQRRSLLIGSVAGISGQTSTKQGSAEDADVLVVSVTESPWAGAGVLDNRLPREFGTFELSQVVSANNALGFGEQFSVSAASSMDFDRYLDGTAKSQSYATDFILPIGVDGFTVLSGYVSVRSRPTPYPGTFSESYNVMGERGTGDYDRAYLQAAYPLLLTMDRSVKVAATYDHVDLRTRINPLPSIFSAPVGFGPSSFNVPVGFGYDLSRDQYSVARFAADAKTELSSWWEWGGSASLLTIYSHGLGGRTAIDLPLIGAIGVPLSRPEANPTFNRFALKAGLNIGLPENFQLTGVFRSQTSFGKPLMIPENLSLDGFEAVSGYAAGTLNVDRGITLRSELSRGFSVDWFESSNNTIAPYLFAAYGRGSHETTYVGETRRHRAETIGSGLRADTSITGSPYGESLSLEFGKDFSNLPFHESGYRANVSFNVRFAGDSLYAAPFTPQKTLVTKSPKAAQANPTEIWTGAYAGLNAGYVWDPQGGAYTFGAPAQTDLDALLSLDYTLVSALAASGTTAASGGGALGGGQIGYTRQSERVLLGLETDLQGTNPRSRGSLVSYGQEAATGDVALSAIEHNKDVEWLGTARGRLGFLPWPELLAYATGGLAFGKAAADVHVTQDWTGPFLAPYLNSIGSVGQFAGVKTGWTIGAGLEWMFAPNLSLKGEILYYELGAARFASSPLFTQFGPIAAPPYNSVALSTRAAFRGDIVRLGLNYHFRDFGFTASAASAWRLPEGFSLD